MDFDGAIHLGNKIKELEAELKKYKERVAELEAQVEIRKKRMPNGGNTHKVPVGLAFPNCSGPRDIEQSERLFRNSLRRFMDLSESKVYKSGKGYICWKKAMEFARKDKYIKQYAKVAGVQITARNVERWYKHYVTHEIQLNTSKK